MRHADRLQVVATPCAEWTAGPGSMSACPHDTPVDATFAAAPGQGSERRPPANEGDAMNGSTEGNRQGAHQTATAHARAGGQTHWTRFLYCDAVPPSRGRLAEKRTVRATRPGPWRWLLRQRRRSPLAQGATLLGLYIVAHVAVGAVLRLTWWAASAAPDAARLLLHVQVAHFPLL
jgi:hypothetical protein